MKKRLLALLLAGAMSVGLAACGNSGDEGSANTPAGGETTPVTDGTGEPSAEGKTVKVGMVCIGDENDQGYTYNFMKAVEEATAQLAEQGITVEWSYKKNILEDSGCEDANIELAEDGCDIIINNSYGFEPFMLKVAPDYPKIEFISCTNQASAVDDLDNTHNAFANIYEGRYVAGVVAGMKIKELIDSGKITADKAKMGYVGAFTYAEVISGYTSFFLGARSVCPTATMEVTFTGSWYDETAEKEGAEKLIQNGCVLISQHADSMGAPTACEKAGVPNVSYNGSTVSVGPNTYIISSRIDWAPYYVHAIQAVMDGKEIEADWTGTLATKSVVLSDLNTNVAADGTQAAIDEAIKKLESGELHVFDVSTFTVSGENVTADMKTDTEGHLTSYMADVDNDANMEHDTEVVHDGYFAESEKRSAPYFDIAIDGIVRLDVNFG
mgnify:CR=1 FL=1